MIEVSVVIPMHNEGQLGREFALNVFAHFRDAHSGSFEVIIIDDGSTPPVQIPSFHGLHLIRLSTRHGSGYARRIGTSRAQGEWVLWVDADSTYPIQEIWKIYSLREGAEQSVGARSTDFGPYRGLRLLVKRAASGLAAWLFQHPIPDLNSGLRIFSRASATWLHFLPQGFSCTTTATLGAIIAKQRIRFIPISYAPRSSARSKFRPIRDGLLLFFKIFQMRVYSLTNVRRVKTGFNRKKTD